MVKFKNKFIKELSYLEIEDAKLVIDTIRTLNSTDIIPTASILSEELAMQQVRVRKIIQNIRENSTELLRKGEYLIAYKRGYSISKDKKAIRKWINGRHKRAVSGLAQVEQGWECLKK